MSKTEFETFRDLTSNYFISLHKQDEPSNVNFLSYRRYKVSIELIEEPNDVLIERLENMRKEQIGYDRKQRIIEEIKKLKQ